MQVLNEETDTFIHYSIHDQHIKQMRFQRKEIQLRHSQ